MFNFLSRLFNKKKPEPVLTLEDAQIRIDWHFIRTLEGYETRGYVPQDANGVIGQSGVTIGTGIDLGQMSVSELERLYVSDEIKLKLLPYTGLKKKDAVNFLKRNPLTLSNYEVNCLDLAVKMIHAKRLASSYNRQSKKFTFEKLPRHVQTVIMSVAFQYGSLASRCPRFWKQCLEFNVKEMVKELENFGDAFPTRRMREAKYLKNGGEVA